MHYVTTTKLTRSINKLQVKQIYPFIISLNPREYFCNCNVLIDSNSKIFIQYRSGAKKLCLYLVSSPLMAHVWFTWWTGVVWQIEAAHLGEPVRTHISFTIGVYYFTEPSKRTVWFWHSLEVNQFLSYNRLQSEPLVRLNWTKSKLNWKSPIIIVFWGHTISKHSNVLWFLLLTKQREALTWFKEELITPIDML